MQQQVYRLHDSKPEGGMQHVKLADAQRWNAEGWGIFVTVNDFKGARRKQNLRKINAFAIDMDSGTKDEMADRIRAGLTPSMVIESKRGFHVWWLAKDAEPAYWNAIVWDRLVPFYGADKNAKDICRVLRMPGFMHLKDPANPFLIKKVFEYPVEYTQEQIARFYPDKAAPERNDFVKKAISQTNTQPMGNNFWQNVFRIDCMEGLEKLSGSEFVNNEVFTFRHNPNGKYNIYVNGKGTSCFIDENMRIGSSSGGGPTVGNFLHWYGHDWRKVAEILKTTFPELESHATKKV
jgi:hypothetical protein